MKHITIHILNKYVNEYQTFLNLLKRKNIIQDFMITYLDNETYEIEITYIER